MAAADASLTGVRGRTGTEPVCGGGVTPAASFNHLDIGLSRDEEGPRDGVGGGGGLGATVLLVVLPVVDGECGGDCGVLGLRSGDLSGFAAAGGGARTFAAATAAGGGFTRGALTRAGGCFGAAAGGEGAGGGASGTDPDGAVAAMFRSGVSSSSSGYVAIQ